MKHRLIDISLGMLRNCSMISRLGARYKFEATLKRKPKTHMKLTYNKFNKNNLFIIILDE